MFGGNPQLHSVFSSVGENLVEVTPSESSLVLDVSTLPNGVYFVKIQFGNRTITKSSLKLIDMRAFICLVFLGMALLCHAQKVSKNEFSFGYFTAGNFFDSTSMKFSKFIRGKNITLSYTRHIDKHLFLNATYIRAFYQYFSPPVPEFLEDNSIIYRGFKVVSGNVGYRISKWSMSAKVRAGANYRFAFSKGVHFTYFNGGNWNEPREAIIAYNSVGATLGLTVSHPIVWKIFGEFDCEYARMFSKYNVDQNQLLLSYRIGMRF